MDGMSVTLIDKSNFVARCWDDDRLLVNLLKFLHEIDGGATLVHEFGHRIWFQCLDRRAQDRWYKSWLAAKQKRSARGGPTCGALVSEYACTDEIEDFAEVFRAIVYGEADRAQIARWVDVCGGSCGSRARASRRASRASRRTRA
jgi:hypothetical protein